MRRQFAFGYVARLDVAAQESALAQVQQTLPPLRKQLEQNRCPALLHPHALRGGLAQDDLGASHLGRRPHEGPVPARAAPAPQEPPRPEKGDPRCHRLDAHRAAYHILNKLANHDLGADHFDRAR
jgi:hypothetical protein